MTLHIFSGRPIGQKRFPGHWLAGLMMEAPENFALLIDSVIFLHNNISLGMMSHPSEDILVRNPALSLFRGILQVGE